MAERYGETPDSAHRDRALRRGAGPLRRPPRRSTAPARSSRIGRDRSGGGSRAPTLPADGQMSARTQSPQRGRRASHTWRPCSMSRSESKPHSSGATMPSRSSSIFTGSVSFVSFSRCAEPRDVRVDGQAGQAEPDRPHDVAGLAPDTGQRDEVVELGRDLAAEALLDRLRHPDEVLRLRAEEAGRLDERLDVVRIGGREVGRRRILREQRGRHHVDALVGGLRRQDRRRRAARTRCGDRARTGRRDTRPVAAGPPLRRAPGLHEGGP